jgi:hypothetical protein
MKIRLTVSNREIPGIGKAESGKIVDVCNMVANDLIAQGMAEKIIVPKKFRAKVKKVGETE